MLTHQEKVAVIIADAMQVYDAGFAGNEPRDEYKQGTIADVRRMNAAEVNNEYRLICEAKILTKPYRQKKEFYGLFL